MQMAGQDVTAHLFRICEACGKLDSGVGSNTPREHRAWCRYRQSADERTLELALSRELVTQGVAVILPPSIVGDMHSLPSLAAALPLGLREVMGGAPNHLRVGRQRGRLVPDSSSRSPLSQVSMPVTERGGSGFRHGTTRT